MTETGPDYVMGHNDRERRRLALQAAVINPLTDSFLRRAGVSAGMRVLDLGCGIGEVTGSLIKNGQLLVPNRQLKKAYETRMALAAASEPDEVKRLIAILRGLDQQRKQVEALR